MFTQCEFEAMFIAYSKKVWVILRKFAYDFHETIFLYATYTYAYQNVNLKKVQVIMNMALSFLQQNCRKGTQDFNVHFTF